MYSQVIKRSERLVDLKQIRRSDRLRGKKIDYSIFFKTISLKDYTAFYKCLIPKLRNSPTISSKPNYVAKNSKKNFKNNSFAGSRAANEDRRLNITETPVERVQKTLSKLTTKCKTKGLMSRIIVSNFHTSTPLSPRRNKSSTPISDDYFAYVSPISSPNESRDHVSVRDVVDISQQFAKITRKTRENLSSIAEEVKGRPLEENEMDELQTTIHGLDLSNFYQGPSKKLSRSCRTEQIFVPNPMDLESIASTPRSSVFRFENRRTSPSSIRYARHIERHCSFLSRRSVKSVSKKTDELSHNSPKNTNTSKLLEKTFTNVKKMMRVRRSSDSYEEEDSN